MTYSDDDGHSVNDKFNAHFWHMGMENFRNFFLELDKMETKSLTLTKQVLDERKRLETTVEGLQQLIRRDLGNVDNIRKLKQAILDNEAHINARSNVSIQVDVIEVEKETIPEGKFLTNCSKCHVTCHYPCHVRKDEDKNRCSAMTDGKCRICPEKCIWNVHFNQPYKWNYVPVSRTIESDEVKAKYEQLMNKQLTAQELANVLEADQKQMGVKVLQSVQTVTDCIRQLESIALRPSAFSTTQYIDLMIASERMEKQPGFAERIQSLTNLRKQIDLTNQIRAGQFDRNNPVKDDNNPDVDKSQLDSSAEDSVLWQQSYIQQKKFEQIFDE